MHLNTGRIGPLLSDRLVIDEKPGDVRLRVDHSLTGWALRSISWIHSPASYSKENSKTVDYVKKYFERTLGEKRLERICKRYDVQLDGKGPLLSRDVAKILIGARDVKIEDIEEYLRKKKEPGEAQEKVPELTSERFFDIYEELSQAGQQLANIQPLAVEKIRIDKLIEISKKEPNKWPKEISRDLRGPLSQAINCQLLERKDSATFKQVRKELSKVTGQFGLSGAEPSEVAARYFFDPFLADRERMLLAEDNPTDTFKDFVHNFVVRIIGREMEVGMLIPAPNKGDQAQFYVVAAKIITGKGMVSYVLTPATNDTDLKPIRFFRGTATRPSAIDATSSMITDMEPELGRAAFESGEFYEPLLEDSLGEISVAAGHSLGSTTLQYYLAKYDHIKEAYLHNGPGIPESVVEKFNQRMSADGPLVHLHIGDAESDLFSTVGEVHLGHKSPNKRVNVLYKKSLVHPEMTPGDAHVHVDARNLPYAPEVPPAPHSPAERNRQLHRQSLPERLIPSMSNETLRKTIGPTIGAIIRCVRDIFRNFFGARALSQRGLQIGKFTNEGKWTLSWHIESEPNTLPSSSLPN